MSKPNSLRGFLNVEKEFWVMLVLYLPTFTVHLTHEYICIRTNRENSQKVQQFLWKRKKT